MKLKQYKKIDFTRGSCLKRASWYLFGTYFVESKYFFCSMFKVAVLRFFGAKIGEGCVIKPGVRVKMPWKLILGSDVWLGENAWIDNIETVYIGDNVCISQEAYLCTGNHDWTKEDFPLIAKSIKIENGVWIGAKSIVGPGVFIEKGAVLTLGSTATKNLAGNKVYCGNPAVCVKERKVSEP